MDRDFQTRFEDDKRNATAQLLMKCARLVNDRAIARIRTQTGKPLRAAHTALFPHLDMAGTRQTVLAERLGISKQAVGQLVNDMVDMGFLELVPDPSDGRAKLIRLIPAELTAGLQVLKAVEEELVDMIGAAHMQAMRAALIALETALEQNSSD